MFLEVVRPESHRRDIATYRSSRDPHLVDELERSAAEYAWTAQRLRELPAGGPLRAPGEHAGWCSAATHAVLPMLASDATVVVEVQTGITSHRRRFGTWAGGFWLPECGQAPWLGPLLEEPGVRSTCVELTREFGLGDERHLRPLRS
jgi:1,4-alpha-glucan branching enzyme